MSTIETVREKLNSPTTPVAVVLVAAVGYFVVSWLMGSGGAGTRQLDSESVARLTDPETRIAEIRRLGRQRRAEAVPFLKALSTAEQAATRLEAIRALRDIGTRPAIQALRDRVFDPVAEVRCELADALARRFTSTAHDGLIYLVGDRAPEVRRCAAEAMGNLAAHAEVVETLGKALKDDAPEVRRAAVESIARSDSRGATALLATALKDPDATVRLRAAAGLRDRPGERAARALAGAVSDPAGDVRALATEALRARRKEMLPFVRDAMDRDAPIDARVSAARTLGALGDPQAAPAILGLLNNPPRRRRDRTSAAPEELHGAVVDALASLGAPALEPVLDDTLLGEAGRAAEAAAAEACARIGPPAGEAVAERLMAWRIFPDPGEMKLWLETLGEVASAEALPALRRAAAQGDPALTRAAEHAREAIARRTGASVPALRAEPGLLADAPSPSAYRPIRPVRVAVTPLAPPAGQFPKTDGVLRVDLASALRPLGRNPRPADMRMELIRRDGAWEREFLVHAPRFNKRTHRGRIIRVDGRTIEVEVLFYNDFWRKSAYGEYTLNLADDGGRYTGHCNFRKVAGKLSFAGYGLPAARPEIPPLKTDEHPRLLFRPHEIETLRARARTPFGKRVIAAIRARIAGQKHLHRGRFNYVTNWEPGMDLVIAHGFLATLFEDPRHVRLAAPLLIERSELGPYGGEHGERMPRPLSLWAYGYDLAHNHLTGEERRSVEKRKGFLPGMFDPVWGPRGVWAASRSLFPVPGQTALAFLHDKGPFSIPEPKKVATVLVLEGRKLEKPDSAEAVNDFRPGRIPGKWLWLGPVGDEAEVLAAAGGAQKLRPRGGEELAVDGKKHTWEALPASAIREIEGLGEGSRSVRLPGVKPGQRSFLFAHFRTDEDVSFLVKRFSALGHRWLRVWLDGKAVPDGSVAVLEPGLHRVLLEARGAEVRPMFPAVDARDARARWAKYRWLHAEWTAARDRHAKTGRYQAMGMILDACRAGVRTNLLREIRRKRAARSGNLQWSFLYSCYVNLARALAPDTPIAVAAGVIEPSQVRDRELCFVMGLVDGDLRRKLAAEFDRRFGESLSGLNCLELIGALNTYPIPRP